MGEGDEVITSGYDLGIFPPSIPIGEVVDATGESAAYYTAGEVFDALAKSHPRFSGLSYDTLGLRGLPVLESVAGAAS